ncbi:pyocin activator PrtN family protein [Burkholderia diffusa]|uniref:pyocin activator PrtN family protein n=1 Tax=Burkholderia diffusa TaxID=488732 RepID=UPI000751AB57|nr:pyocin activator PrtN family protein [Burkholderia diffusa]KVG32848.1 Pyocin activator protein PrtN [Burkholderia diffusa]
MKTILILLAQYDARAIVPIDLVCRDYFSHLTVPQFVRKINAGEIALPLIRIDTSLKSAKGVHIEDLAAFIDKQRAAAIKEYETFHGKKWITE